MHFMQICTCMYIFTHVLRICTHVCIHAHASTHNLYHLVHLLKVFALVREPVLCDLCKPLPNSGTK